MIMEKIILGFALVALTACGTSSKKSEGETPVGQLVQNNKAQDEAKPSEGKTPETVTPEVKAPEDKPVDETKKPEPVTPDINDTLKQLTGTWYNCRAVSFSRAVPAAASGFTFHADGTFEEFDTVFSDKECTQALTAEQAKAAGLGADFLNQWNESASGQYTISAAATAGVFNIDTTYDDEEEAYSLYRIFKIEDSKLIMTKIQNCFAPDSNACKNVGTTADNRPANFLDAQSYSKR